ncbi:MAG: hypothetical protein Fur0037_28260 [Planctomycetota bacterium]
MARLPIVLSAALACAVPAQQFLHLAVAGPAAQRARLGPTNLGTMLASEEAAEILAGYTGSFAREVRALRGDDDALDREPRRWLDYAGTVHLVAWVEQKEDALHLARWSAALIVEADQTSGLRKMAADIASWKGRLERGMERSWRSMALGDTLIEDGRLLVVLAEDADRRAATARARGFRPAALGPREALSLEIDLQAALGLLRDRGPERGLASALLGGGTEKAVLQIGASGPRVRLELSLRFRTEDRGLAEGLFPIASGVPDMAYLIPPSAAASMVGRTDPSRLLEACVAGIAEVLDEDAGAVRDLLRDRCGCDPGTDLLAKVGDETLAIFFDSESAGRSLLDQVCLVLSLRDEKGLIEAAGEWMRRVGILASVDDDGVLWAETEKFGGTHVAIGLGHLCIAFGPDAVSHLNDVLDAAFRGGQTRLLTEAPPEAPPGWNGQGTIDAERLLAGHLATALAVLPRHLGYLGEWASRDSIAREVGRWLPMLRRHRLNLAETLAGTTEESWCFLVLW